jgi:hypothetical protein
MKKKYFRLFLLCCLLLTFASVGFAQKKQRVTKINSLDFKKDANKLNRNNGTLKGKKWRKRCRWTSYRRNGRVVRVRRCRTVRY